MVRPLPLNSEISSVSSNRTQGSPDFFLKFSPVILLQFSLKITELKFLNVVFSELNFGHILRTCGHFSDLFVKCINTCIMIEHEGL